MFDVGDLVVCVDAVSPPQDEPFFSADTIQRGYAFLVQGKHYRVSAVVRDGMLRFPGDPFPPANHIGFNPDRFRKIDAPDTEVSRLIRACKPVREGQPA